MKKVKLNIKEFKTKLKIKTENKICINNENHKEFEKTK